MKSLYESLLSNTNGGMQKTVQEWCEKYFERRSNYTVDKGGIIHGEKNGNIWVDGKAMNNDGAEIPDYIAFADMPDTNFLSESVFNSIPSKLPKVVKKMNFGLETHSSIENLDISVSDGIVFNYSSHLEHIKNWHITNANKEHGYEVNFGYTNLPFEDFKELDCPGCTALYLVKSPCGDYIWNKIIKKKLNAQIQRSKDCYYPNPSFAKELDTLFEKFPDVRFVNLTPGRALEHVGGNWYIYLHCLPNGYTPFEKK